MKKIIFGLLAVLVLFSACETKPTFSIKGKLSGESDQPLVIGLVEKDGYKTVDTITVVDGIIDYQLELAQPMLVVIGLEGSRQRKAIFGENVAYTIDGDINNIKEATVTGGELFKAYAAIEAIEQENAQKSKS